MEEVLEQIFNRAQGENAFTVQVEKDRELVLRIPLNKEEVEKLKQPVLVADKIENIDNQDNSDLPVASIITPDNKKVKQIPPLPANETSTKESTTQQLETKKEKKGGRKKSLKKRKKSKKRNRKTLKSNN